MTEELKNRVLENKVLTKDERIEIVKALEIVEEFEKAQIITGGRLNGRTYAYKCGLEDGKRKALEQQPSENCVSREQGLKKLKESAKHHANWIENDKGAIVCSCCNTWFPKERKEFMWKCPYCFADMRGSENE